MDAATYKSAVNIGLATAVTLLLPLVAMQFTNEVDWGVADFVVGAVLLFGAGLTFELLRRKRSNLTYRVAVGAVVASALLLVWANLAVGIL